MLSQQVAIYRISLLALNVSQRDAFDTPAIHVRVRLHIDLNDMESDNE